MTLLEYSHVYIIAEAGVNHNGSINMAKQLVDVAAEAGADAVKFQTFTAERLVSKDSPKARYQKETTDTAESQFAMLKRLELDEQMHYELVNYCCKKSIQFLSTPFDQESLRFLAGTLGVSCIKISSGEITNAPFLLEAAGTGKPIFLSTGMSLLGEVEDALKVLAFGYLKQDKNPSWREIGEAYFSQAGQEILREKVTLLHCTSEYPAPFTEVRLRAMQTMEKAFRLPVGFSDHTRGLAMPIAAAALGAVVIEKHFTIDRKLPGPDHKASLEPQELKMMVQQIRQVELALGDGKKIPGQCELTNRDIVRKSLVAAADITEGQPFTNQNLTVKRPGTGISPTKYWEWIGKKADRKYCKDELIMDE